MPIESSAPHWSRGLPAPLARILPGAPCADSRLADNRCSYEYKLLVAEGARATVLVRVAGDGDITPSMLAKDVSARSNARWTQCSAANPVMRYTNDDAYMLHDRRFKCDSASGCAASMRIRAWIPTQAPSARDLTKTPRTCAHCGRKGHRKQSCCEARGNCRLEIDWTHNHPVPPPSHNPPLASSSLPAKRPPERSAVERGPVKKSRSDPHCSHPEGAPCARARSARTRATHALQRADAAMCALRDALATMSTAHKELSALAVESSSALCTTDSLRHKRDMLQKEVDDLIRKRNDVAVQPPAPGATNPSPPQSVQQNAHSAAISAPPNGPHIPGAAAVPNGNTARVTSVAPSMNVTQPIAVVPPSIPQQPVLRPPPPLLAQSANGAPHPQPVRAVAPPAQHIRTVEPQQVRANSPPEQHVQSIAPPPSAPNGTVVVLQPPQVAPAPPPPSVASSSSPAHMAPSPPNGAPRAQTVRSIAPPMVVNAPKTALSARAIVAGAGAPSLTPAPVSSPTDMDIDKPSAASAPTQHVPNLMLQLVANPTPAATASESTATATAVESGETESKEN